ELSRDPRDLRFRDGPHLAHGAAEHRLARHLDLPVLRRLRGGHRLAHLRHRRGQLRGLYSAGPHHALAVDAEHHQRLVRDLLSEVHGHDLRDPVSPRLLRRDRHQLRRGRGDQVGDPGPHHPRHLEPLRATPDHAPALDADVPDPHRLHLQPLRLRARHLGRRLREAPTRALPHRHAPDLPRRQLLLHRYAAPVLADGHPLQPRRLPHKRLPLELLRGRRRERRPEHGHDGPLPGPVPDGCLVDLQNGLPPENL
ncbi:MAG: Efflux ABC transporter, permease protein, partial [uncultured Rubrobacteraceae bacterium]